jgi:hypothetical protein
MSRPPSSDAAPPAGVFPMPEMNPLERAATLKQEAGQIMEAVRLKEIVQPYGAISATGSYDLDVMVYPDLDVMIPKVSVEQLFHIAGQLARFEKVLQVVFERSNEPLLPDGLYLKPRIDYGQWGRPWKIDIWSLHGDTIQQRLRMMQAFRERMTAGLREQIIRYKLAILTREKRTPMHSGYFIYKAFLEEGLRDFAQVTHYLRANGIDVG